MIGPLVALALSAGRSPSLTSELGVRRIPRKTLHKRVFLSVLRHIIVNSASSSTNQGSCLWRRLTFTPTGRLFIDITARHIAKERDTYHLTALGASTRGYSGPNVYQEHDFATKLPTH